MKYLFILGRNIELSKQEVFSYFEKEGNRILKFEIFENGLLIDLEKLPDKNIVDNFGGVISIGKVLEEGKLDLVMKNIEKRELYFGKKNNFNYVLWNFCKDNSEEELSIYLKKRFRSEKLKATQKPFSGFIKTQEGEEVKNIVSKNIDEEFFIFGNEKNLCFGKVFEKCDYEKLEARDMQKPVRREELAISPRLAKIMVNLSQAKNYEKILDPFCGIGVVLQEALLQRIDVLGIDRDSEAVKGCIKNLEWFNFPKKHYKVLHGDSTRLKISEKINAIVSEPDLGKILKKIPKDSEAKATLEGFEKLIINVVNNFKNNFEGDARLVFTAPLIKLHSGKRMSCNFERIANETGFSLLEGFPIKEFRENQIVGREIFVLEK